MQSRSGCCCQTQSPQIDAGMKQSQKSPWVISTSFEFSMKGSQNKQCCVTVMEEQILYGHGFTDSPDIVLRTCWPVWGHRQHALSHPLTSAWMMGGQSTNTSHLSHIQKTRSTLSLQQHLSLLLSLRGISIHRYIFQSPPQKQRTDPPLWYLLYLPANRHQKPACQWRTEMRTSSWGTGDEQTFF